MTNFLAGDYAQFIAQLSDGDIDDTRRRVAAETRPMHVPYVAERLAVIDAEIASRKPEPRDELLCDCGAWNLIPLPGEVIACKCGNKFETRPAPAEADATPLKRAKFLQDIIITAVEGGVGYWSYASVYRWSDAHPETARVTLSEFDDAGAVTQMHHVTGATIERGIKEIMSGAPKHVSSEIEAVVRGCHRENEACSDAGDIDSDIADAIVQVGLFGDLVYG